MARRLSEQEGRSGPGVADRNLVPVQTLSRAACRADSSPLEKTFRDLLRQWQAETAQSSDVHEKILHPAHLRIIGLGPEVLPLVFGELKARGGLWFWALEALTGADPVPETARTMKEVREAWLQYGREQGYV